MSHSNSSSNDSPVAPQSKPKREIPKGKKKNANTSTTAIVTVSSDEPKIDSLTTLIATMSLIETPISVVAPVIADIITTSAIASVDPISRNVNIFVTWLEGNSSPHIQLLREKTVVQWLFGDLSYLPSIEKKNKTKDTEKLKILEDEWGRKTLKIRRPDLKLDKQWTNMFGEHLCEEIYTLLGKVVSKPTKRERYCPDREVDDAIIEAKAETYFTTGTAGEKILGVPFKYAEVPELFGKPLKILCLGGAEKECREEYGNLPGTKCSKQKSRFLEFFKENRIEFIGATDILRSLSSESTPLSS